MSMWTLRIEDPVRDRDPPYYILRPIRWPVARGSTKRGRDEVDDGRSGFVGIPAAPTGRPPDLHQRHTSRDREAGTIDRTRPKRRGNVRDDVPLVDLAAPRALAVDRSPLRPGLCRRPRNARRRNRYRIHAVPCWIRRRHGHGDG